VDRSDRFYRIVKLLREQTVVTTRKFTEELEVSLATFKRDLEYLKSTFNAPIEYDRDKGGYSLTGNVNLGPTFELPGLWFNPSEIHALLTMRQLLTDIQPGLLEASIQPLMARLEKLLDRSTGYRLADIESRVHVERIGGRAPDNTTFQTCASGLLERRRLLLAHFNRTRGEHTSRTVSPQRLTYYRSTWYLDAWCHLRDGIRSFALDAIEKADKLDAAAKEVSTDDLEAVIGAGYGIYSGKDVQWAVLRFNPASARWVAHEQWHKDQRSRVEPDGTYVLEVPYSADEELIMDVLRHGPNVEVAAPPELRQRVAARLGAAAGIYNGDSA
jgi:predicted DNA-binding transcriptional regulator YafY